MPTRRETFSIETKEELQAIDITDRVTRIVRASGLKEGIAVVFVAGSTCAVAATESEPGLLESDIPAALERLAPHDGRYAHNVGGGDANGHSHVRSTVLGSSVTLPFGEGKPLLGAWQHIVLFELDIRSRKREVVVQLVGE